MKKTVVCNNGHGRLQAGKVSPELGFDHPLRDRIMKECRSKQFRLFEWWSNREIVRHICHQLSGSDVKCVNLVPDSENYGKFLEGRVARANKIKHDLYVAVHSDAFGDGEFNHVRGHHVFYAAHPEIAQIFNNNIAAILPESQNRGVVLNPSPKAPSRFYELHGTKMPAVLTETLFYTSELDCRLLLDSIEIIAQGHVNAILEWSKL